MPFQFSPFANDQFLDGNGNIATGYKLFTYLAGTTTKEPVYTDVAGTIPHSNPIVLNSIGRPPSPIFINNAKNYKFVLATPTDSDPPASPVYTADNVSVKIPTSTTLTTPILDMPLINYGTCNANPITDLGVATKQYVDFRSRLAMLVM